MLKFSLAAGAVAAAMIAAPAMAQDAPVTGWYGSLGYTESSTTGAMRSDLGAITGRIGDRINNWIGLEGELSGGVQNGTAFSGFDKVHLDHQYAGYVVGYVPVLPKLDLLARVGYGSERFDTTFDSFSSDTLNYGVGAQYFVTAKDGVRLDYTRFDRQSGLLPSSNNWTISYVRRF